MNALLPFLLPMVVGTASAEYSATSDAAAGTPTGGADLVEVHISAGTPGVRLVCKPPASAGPDAEPYIIEVFVPTWAEPVEALNAGMADEPIAAAPVMLATPTTLASAVPTASYATQPIEPTLPAPPAATAFLRHAPIDDLEPKRSETSLDSQQGDGREVAPATSHTTNPPAPADIPTGSATMEPVPQAPPAPKEAPAPPPEWASAATNFEKACDGGYAQACTALAEMVAGGRAGEPDMDRAHTLYERGCDSGDDNACAAIAPTSAPSVPLAMPTAAPAVADAQPMALQTQPSPAPAPAAEAPAFVVERDLFDACQHGENDACNELGERHTHGDAVSQDYGRAAKLFQRACAGGEMSACTNLGILYKVGEGVTQDELRAERLFQLACNGSAGDERACGLAEE